MAFTPKTGKMTWSRSTPNDGELFEAEFNKVYDNTDYLKAEIEANTADINTLNTAKQPLLPIGTILIYDGTNWQDNVTLAGWYACVAANAVHGCPDLVDRFIMGGTSAGTTGGSNSITLAVTNLPSHNHNINHSHSLGTSNVTSGTVSHDHTHTINHDHGSQSFTTVGQSNSHAHAQNVSAWDHIIGGTAVRNDYDDNTVMGGVFPQGIYTDGNNYDHTHSVAIDLGNYEGSSGGISQNHSHTVNIDHSHSHSGVSGNTGSDTAFDNRPNYYTIIYIKRCS